MDHDPQVKGPALDMIEKRIWQLMLLMTVVILYLTLLLVAYQLTGFMGLSEAVSLPQNAYKYAVSLTVLILLFLSYVILHHRRLFKVSRALLEEQDLTRSLDRSLRTVKSLLEVSSSINAKKRLPSILDLITREAMDSFLADSASIMLLNAKTGTLETMASHGRDSDRVRQARVGIGESVAGWVAEHRKPLLLNGLVSSKDFAGLEPRESAVASSLCVPLKSGARCIGVMNVNRYEGGDPFTEDDLDLITVFANNASIAIQNAGMYAKLKRFSSDLENQVRARTRELEAANRAKSDFLASVGHELRTPLNAVIGFSDVLLKGHFGTLNQDQKSYANDILENGKHLLGIIDALLDFSTGEAGRTDLALTDVDLGPLIENALDLVRTPAGHKGHTLQAGLPAGLEGQRVKANAEALERILFQLLSNAVKFTTREGDIRVEAELVEDCGARIQELKANGLLAPGEEGGLVDPAGLRGVEVSVADNGEGIAPENLARVFEPFFQGGEGLSGKRPGTGLGLARARRLVEIHGGRIWGQSPGKGKGSRFSFLLPMDPEGNGRFRDTPRAAAHAGGEEGAGRGD